MTRVIYRTVGTNTDYKRVAEIDAIFRNKLGVAMASGHDGLAKLISDSESSGTRL